MSSHTDTGCERRSAEDADETEPRDDAHLEGVADGCGCTEVWEHLSERREE